MTWSARRRDDGQWEVHGPSGRLVAVCPDPSDASAIVGLLQAANPWEVRPHPFAPSEQFVDFCADCGAHRVHWSHEEPTTAPPRLSHPEAGLSAKAQVMADAVAAELEGGEHRAG